MSSVVRITGEELESEVARIYRLLGAETQERILIGHYEIDVHAVMRVGPFLMSFVVECKQYRPSQAVSDADMRSFVVKLKAARELGRAEKGVFVTTSKFSKHARATAEQNGVQCIHLQELYNQLINFQPYLNSVVGNFDGSDLGRWYVEQTVSELEDYEALNTDGAASVLHPEAIQYVDDRFRSVHQKRLALLGNFGTGKSSFCEALRAHLARKVLANTAMRIPVLIDLREFRGGLDIQQVIVNALQRLPSVQASAQVCLELQRMGRFFFLLDGLDEMASRVDRAVINESLQEIDRLRTAGDNRYIVTCRTHFFQESVLDAFLADYDVLYLTEWSSAQIRTYFDKRFGAEGPSKCQRTLADPRIAELARTPLLLDILLNTPNLGAENLHVYGLLTKYTEQWIVKQCKRRGAVMTAPQRRRFVLALASHMYAKNSRNLHFSELYEVAREFCGHSDASRVDHFDADARTCTFITRDSNGNYSFRYQAFYDYFSAAAIGDAIDAGDREPISTRPLSDEITELISGRGIQPEGLQHLRAWAAKFDHVALSSNAVSLLTGLGQKLPDQVSVRFGVAGCDLKVGDANRLLTESFVRNWGRLIRVARRYVPNGSDAQDVVHDVFAKVLADLNRRELKVADLDAYLVRAVRNRAMDYARLARRGEMSLSLLGEWSRDQVSDAMQEFEAMEQSDAMKSAITTLDEKHRAVIKLIMEGQSLAEIAATLGFHIRHVLVLYKSACRILATALKLPRDH